MKNNSELFDGTASIASWIFLKSPWPDWSTLIRMAVEKFVGPPELESLAAMVKVELLLEQTSRSMRNITWNLIINEAASMCNKLLIKHLSR